MKKEILIIFFAAALLGMVGAEDSGFFVKTIPNSFEIGDVQFAIQIHNNQNYTITNIAPLISGNGFSTYYIIPVESLDSGQNGYAFVSGNFKNSGNITLSITYGKESFYPVVSVLNSAEINQKQKEELEKRQKEALLGNLSEEINELKQNYSDLENLLSDKKDNNFDISKITLDDAKKYIRTAESYLLAEDIDNAKVNIRLAIEEMNYQRTKLNSAKTISISSRIKDNALLISAVVGAILATLALLEILKKAGIILFSKVKKIKPKKR